jgi:hypothetical protein
MRNVTYAANGLPPGIAFGVRGAELGHHTGRCTLESLIDR